MARQGFMPVSTAVVLTVAAALSIAVEHARRQAAAPDEPHTLSATWSGSDRAARGKAAENDAAPRARTTSGSGSRALTGNEAERLNDPPAPALSKRTPE